MRLISIVVNVVIVVITSSLLARSYDRIVAVVGDRVITLYDLKQAVAARQGDSAEKVLSDLVADMIIDQKVKESKIEISDDELAMAVRRILVQNRMTPEQLRAQVARQGLTYNEYTDKLKIQIARQKFISREVGSKIKLSDIDLRDYYNNHRDKFPGAFEQERDNVFKALFDERLAAAVDAYVARIKKTIFVEVKDDALVDLGR